MVLKGGELLFIIIIFVLLEEEEVWGGQAECHVYKSSAGRIYKVMAGVWRRESDDVAPYQLLIIHGWTQHFAEGNL